MPFNQIISNHIILAILWLCYCLLHSLLASIAVKGRMKGWLGTTYRYYRLGYTLFAFAGLAGIVWFQIKLPSPAVLSIGTAGLIGGTVLSTAGLALMAVCIKNYFLSLSGLLSLFREQVYPSLIIKGVHRYMRHPLYLGTFGFIWGLFLIRPVLSLLISNIVITLYTLLAIRLEEQKLILEFGDAYRRYQAAVPKLIPLWRKQRE